MPQVVMITIVLLPCLYTIQYIAAKMCWHQSIKHVKKLEHNVRSLESLVKFLKERYKFRHIKNMSHSGISHKADNMHQAGYLHDHSNK